MQTQRERFGLVPWIVGIVIVAAIGFGFFHKAVAFSETNGCVRWRTSRARAVHIRGMLKLPACRRTYQ